jgi:hypothetical protein
MEDGADNSEMTYKDMEAKGVLGVERFHENVF